MPELPEVETIVRQLNKTLEGKVINGVKVLREKSFVGKGKELVGKKIKRVWRRSKIIVMDFVGWDEVVLVHLKMTGQLVFIGNGKRVVGGHPTEDWVNDLPSKHTRIIIKFRDGSKLFFNDMRVFGWMKILKKEVWKKEVSKLPPDVIDKEFGLSYFKKVVESSKRAIKLVLLDQRKMGGLGNIYVNDGLFLAKIDPRRSANSLNEMEIKALRKAVRKVVNKGVVLGGATYSNYKDSKGQGGKYQEHFLVYGREGEKCKKCGSKIKKFKLGGRGTYWCKECQGR